MCFEPKKRDGGVPPNKYDARTPRRCVLRQTLHDSNSMNARDMLQQHRAPCKHTSTRLLANAGILRLIWVVAAGSSVCAHENPQQILSGSTACVCRRRQTRVRHARHLKKGIEVARGSLVVESHETALRATQRLFLPLRRTWHKGRDGDMHIMRERNI